jgi:putative heme-binding domain-containing protein
LGRTKVGPFAGWYWNVAVVSSTIGRDPNLPSRPALTFEWKRMIRAILLALLVLLPGALTPAEETLTLVPGDAESGLEVVDDLRLDLLLREPVVANPLYLTFDARGRLWIVQYRQYPWPAGLKLLSRDNVWRNVYSPPFPPPPPHADDSPFRGHDRISIHEDTDGDGRFDVHRVFLDGLNLATAALPGRGGVFVMNPPYLLFYADRDQDDRPDTEQPEVLLSGFGIEDSHSIANSLRWGPDGWIYATQGSTVSAAVVLHGRDGRPLDGQAPVHSLGQNVWRYHPELRRYEIFAEGGGNAFGVEIDNQGRVYSGHNGGDTRGFYYIQGGYSQKNFGKHGELSNPYAFAYYAPMRHNPVVRFTHTFCIYEADALPDRYHGRLLGVNPVENHIVLSEIGPDGATRRTADLGVIVRPLPVPRADWFTPVDIQAGPDGAIYVADWYSMQANHFRNHEGQTNPDLGRVYRLRPHAYTPVPPFDLTQLTTRELIDRYLLHPNRWYRQQTLRLLGDRRDTSVIGMLADRLAKADDATALPLLWALNLSRGFNASRAEQLLQHPVAAVRRWTVRLVGDDRDVEPALAQALLSLAAREPDVETRLQLAATAKRLPAAVAVPLVFTLLARMGDEADLYVPNMLWWALEAHADHPELILTQLQRTDRWQNEYRVGGHRIPENLLRRYAAAGRQADLEVCARLLHLAPSRERRQELVAAFNKAYEGRVLPVLPQSLASQLAQVSGPYALLLGVRQQNVNAIEQALSIVRDATASAEQRLELVRALGDARALPEQTAAALLDVLRSDESPAVQIASLAALQKFSGAEIGTAVATAYPRLSESAQEVARQMLASRAEWATLLLEAVERQSIDRASLEPDVVERLRLHRQPDVAERMTRLFPITRTDAEAREARITTTEQLILRGQGSPLRGRELFQGKANCAKCHRLFAHGGEVGPDLTSYNRSDLRRMLLAIVHPSAEIREGFGSFTAMTDDGRIVAGLKIEHNPQLLVLRGSDGHDQNIPIDEIDEIIPNPQSLMPEGLLDELSQDEIRDLFAYLTSTTPPL